MNSGITRTFTGPVWFHQSKSTPKLPNRSSGPPISPSQGHGRGTRRGAVHQVAEDQPVPEWDDDSGAEEERPVLERGERDGKVGRVRRVLAQADYPENEDDPRRNEDALDDPRTRRSRWPGLVLPPRDRIEHYGRSDVREDEKELQEGSQVNLVVLAATG